MIREFKEFTMRGDVLGLTVDAVIGSASTNIVDQAVQGLIISLVGWFVAMVTGTSDSEGVLSILDWSPTKGVIFAFSNVISAIITFLITDFVLFLVVKAANCAKSLRSREGQVEVEETPTAEDYLSDIHDLPTKQMAEDNTHPVEQTNLSDTPK